MKKIFKVPGIFSISSVFALCIFLLVFSVSARAQPTQGKVGVNTDNPQASLHVVGNLRVDSLKQLLGAKKIVVIDSVTGVFATIPMDSVKPSGGGSGVSSSIAVFQAENNSAISTRSGSPMTRISVTLGSGTYVIFASCELLNTNYFCGTNARFTDGVTVFADSNPYANPIAPWAMTKAVTITAQTTYYLQWYVSGGTGDIQNARITAIKIM